MDTLARIRGMVSSDPLIAFATLFGSRSARAAQGGARPDSDWDVAVFLDANLSPRQRFDHRLALIAELEPEVHVDVVVLNDAPPLLAHRALQGDALVVRDRVAWIRFMVRTLAVAGDERAWGRIHAEARARRLKEGRFGRP